MNNQNITNCTQCGRHCPIDAVSCDRGERFVESLRSGEDVSSYDEHSEHEHGNYRHGGHGHGRHHGGGHGHI